MKEVAIFKLTKVEKYDYSDDVTHIESELEKELTNFFEVSDKEYESLRIFIKDYNNNNRIYNEVVSQYVLIEKVNPTSIEDLKKEAKEFYLKEAEKQAAIAEKKAKAEEKRQKQAEKNKIAYAKKALNDKKKKLEKLKAEVEEMNKLVE